MQKKMDFYAIIYLSEVYLTIVPRPGMGSEYKYRDTTILFFKAGAFRY